MSSTSTGCVLGFGVTLQGGAQGSARSPDWSDAGPVPTHGRARRDELAERFDVVLCFGLLHRVTDTDRVAPGIAWMCGSGGEIVLETYGSGLPADAPAIEVHERGDVTRAMTLSLGVSRRRVCGDWRGSLALTRSRSSTSPRSMAIRGSSRCCERPANRALRQRLALIVKGAVVIVDDGSGTRLGLICASACSRCFGFLRRRGARTRRTNMATGTVKWFKADKGFGFLAPMTAPTTSSSSVGDQLKRLSGSSRRRQGLLRHRGRREGTEGRQRDRALAGNLSLSAQSSRGGTRTLDVWGSLGLCLQALCLMSSGLGAWSLVGSVSRPSDAGIAERAQRTSGKPSTRTG